MKRCDHDADGSVRSKKTACSGQIPCCQLMQNLDYAQNPSRRANRRRKLVIWPGFDSYRSFTCRYVNAVRIRGTHWLLPRSQPKELSAIGRQTS
jgi:hypothetical protein